MFKQTSVNGEDFVGLLGFASDKYAIVAPGFKDVSALNVPTIKTTIYGTNMLGLFCAGNSNGILIPYFIEKEKTAKIKKELKDYETSKGTIQFPNTKKIPLKLITEIVQFKVRENIKKEELKLQKKKSTK